MIDFEYPPAVATMAEIMQALASAQVRPIAREMDENEHSDPSNGYFESIWEMSKASGSVAGLMDKDAKQDDVARTELRTSSKQVMLLVMIEAMSWGDCGVYLATPSPGLGGAAVAAVGTAEQ